MPAIAHAHKLLMTNVLLTGLFGTFLMVAPGVFLEWLGVPTDPNIELVARIYATSLAYLAYVSWIARGSQDRVALQALLGGNVVQDFLLATLFAVATYGGIVRPIGWAFVALFVWEVLSNAQVVRQLRQGSASAD